MSRKEKTENVDTNILLRNLFTACSWLVYYGQNTPDIFMTSRCYNC